MTVPRERIGERSRAADELERRIQRRAASCGVVGLGFIGATVARALANAGFGVTGVDRQAQRVASLSAGEDERIVACSNFSALAGADVVVIAVRVAPTADGAVDLEPLDTVSVQLAALPARPRLIVLATTVPPGTTCEFAARLDAGGPTFVVHAPERLQVDDSVWTIDRIPHIIGGVDDTATRLGCALLETIVNSVVPVASPEAAELAKLLENSSNAVGIALVAEITRLAHELGIEMCEVTTAAATKPFGYRPFHPGPGIGGHCIPNDLRMLRSAARAAGVPTRLLDATVDVTTEMPADTVDRLARILHSRDLELDGADVLLVGLGFKIGTADTAATPAEDIARELRRRGARPLGVDSRATGLNVDGYRLPMVDHRSLGDGRRFTAAVVLAGDPAVSANCVVRSADVVLDAGGAHNLTGELPIRERL